MRFPPFQIIEKPADFACGHTAPIRTQIDRRAPPAVEALAHERLLAAKARAKKMRCMKCVHASWNAELSGEAAAQASEPKRAARDADTTAIGQLMRSQLEKARQWLRENPRFLEFREPPADHRCVGICLHQISTPYGLFETKDLR